MTDFRDRIIIRKDSDPETLIECFKGRLVIFQGEREELLFKVESAVREFAARGEQLAGFGSIMKAKRIIEGPGHYVVIEIDYGRKRGFLARLLRAKE